MTITVGFLTLIIIYLLILGFEETTRYVTEGNERHASLDEGKCTITSV